MENLIDVLAYLWSGVSSVLSSVNTFFYDIFSWGFEHGFMIIGGLLSCYAMCAMVDVLSRQMQDDSKFRDAVLHDTGVSAGDMDVFMTTLGVSLRQLHDSKGLRSLLTRFSKGEFNIFGSRKPSPSDGGADDFVAGVIVGKIL